MPKAQGKKSTAHAQFIWHMYHLRTKCTGERFTVGRYRGLLAQTGLKPADCHSSARRLRAPSAVCPFCQAAHALKPIPELKGELETSYSSRWFQAFCLYASTKGSQGFKLITCDQRPLPNTPGLAAGDAESKRSRGTGRIAQVQGMPRLESGRTRKIKWKAIK